MEIVLIDTKSPNIEIEFETCLFSHPLEFHSRRDGANRVKHKVVESSKFPISAT